MEALLKPDSGLAFWTALNFIVLALLLAKFAWKPIVKSIDERERKIAADIAGAKEANEQALKIKQDLQAQFDDIAKESLAKLQAASALGERQKEKIIEEAQAQAHNLLETAREQIKADTDKAARELKKDMVDIAMLAVKKVIGKEADSKTNAQMVEDFLKDASAK